MSTGCSLEGGDGYQRTDQGSDRAVRGEVVVQRLLEILDPFFFSKIFPNTDSKKAWMGVIQVAAGAGFAFAVPVEIFHTIGELARDSKSPEWADKLLSGIFIGAGTEGFNTLLKFANYKKDSAKVDAGNKMSATGAAEAVKKVNPQP